jgi:hypothetical protein
VGQGGSLVDVGAVTRGGGGHVCGGLGPAKHSAIAPAARIIAISVMVLGRGARIGVGLAARVSSLRLIPNPVPSMGSRGRGQSVGRGRKAEQC